MIKILKFFKKYWDKILTIMISAIALGFSINSSISQYNFSKKYNETSNQVILNSIRLAKYDIRLMKLKAEMGKHGSWISYQQMNFQINSLKQNLQTVRKVQVTNLPKDKSMDYQIYIQTLGDIIYQRVSSNEALKRISENNKQQNPTSGEDAIYLSEDNVKILLAGLNKDLDVLETVENGIKCHRSLYELIYKNDEKTISNYEKQFREVDEELR